MREYNIGDKVRVSTTPTSGGGVYFAQDMYKYRGMYAKITDKYENYRGMMVYSVDIDNGWYSWVSTFFDNTPQIDINDITLN